MTRDEKSVVDQYIKGVNLRVIWALIVCTAVSVSTVLTVYFGIKNENQIMSLRIDLIEKRLEWLENKQR